MGGKTKRKSLSRRSVSESSSAGSHGPNGSCPPKGSAAEGSESRTSPENPDPVLNKSEVVWSFPTRARCPRCGSINTLCRSTRDGIQHRICAITICRWTWKVPGWRV